jgi:group I intron endonuclease
MTIIYKYTNRVNGKVYVGKTERSFKQRNIEHRNDQFRFLTPFHNAIRKYGMENFDSEILVDADSDFGDFFEMAFIAALKANNRLYGYNVATGGEGAPGVRLSVAAKIRLSQIAKTRPRRRYTAEYRQTLREKMSGNRFADGVVLSPEQLARRYQKSLERQVCKRGHLVTADSVYIHKRNGKEYKQCRECRRLRRREQRIAAAISG